MEMRLPFGLSGGELQRVAIARALASEVRLLVCDEPTSALDPVARAEIHELLGALQRSVGFAMLFVTHDAASAASLADRAVLLNAGRATPVEWPMQVARSPV